MGEVLGLFSIPEKDAHKISILLAWTSAQSISLQSREADLDRRLQAAEQEIQTLLQTLASANAFQVTTEAALHFREAELDAQAKTLSVQKTHARADFEVLRADSLGVIKAAVTELENVDVALSREIPKTDIARDVVQAVTDSLLGHIKTLEGKKV